MLAAQRLSSSCIVVLVATAFWAGNGAAADLIWFDEMNGGPGFASFSELQAAYAQFLGADNTVLDFGGLPEGTQLDAQFQIELGVSFLNTAGGRYSFATGLHPEGGGNIEDLTGFDGSYMPDGSPVYLKFDNHLADTPFTILFDRPVAQVGSFVAVGKEGTTHSLTISAYDSTRHLLGAYTLETALWDSMTTRQNFESFFALRSDAPMIARVEILNNSSDDFSNALVVDNLAICRSVAEPAAGAMIVAIAVLAFRETRRR